MRIGCARRAKGRMARGEEIAAPALPARLLSWSGTGLAGMAWLSAAFFGTSIVFFYAGAIAVGTRAQWTATLPGLFDPRAPMGTAGIAAHFAAGGTILLLGPIQLVSRIRGAAPAFHRWAGRIYVLAAFVAGIGGLTFIAANGTIGGPAMSFGFAG